MSTRVAQQSVGEDAPRTHPLKSKLSSGLLRKLTTKLKPPVLHPRSANPTIASPPTSPIQPSTRRPVIPAASTDVAAVKRRQAALQQCGLVPLPSKDLSQLEEELDRELSHVVVLPNDQPEQGELTTAEKIRREWQAKNETQPEKQGGLDPKDPTDVTSDSLRPECLDKLDFTRNAEEQKTSHTLLSSTGPVSLYPIPGTFSFPAIPEEDAATSETEKALPPTPPTETVDPPSIPLPDSPLSSSINLLETSSTPSHRESKRPPPIIINLTTSDAKENTEGIARGRSPNQSGVHSPTTKSSLPALSPTMTASSFSSILTPRDDESRERMEVMITRSSSAKSRSSRFGKVSGTGRDSDDLDVVHETIPESPELTATESKTWDPNRESVTTMGSVGFEAFVEKRERRRMSTGIFQSSRRNSGSSSRKSTSSELSSRWNAIANDFSLKPLDGGKSRSSTLLSTSASTDEKNDITTMQSQPVIEQPQSKITRSKSVIASFGLKMSRRMAPQPAMSALPSRPLSPVRRPTVRIVQNRENLIQEVKGIEDDESRRLTELAFMDF